MVKANINSKNNVFLTKEGLVFNSEFTLVKPPIYKKYNISVINRVKGICFALFVSLSL